MEGAAGRYGREVKGIFICHGWQATDIVSMDRVRDVQAYYLCREMEQTCRARARNRK